MQKDVPAEGSESRNVRLRDFFYHLVVFLFVLALLVVTGASGAVLWLALFWGFAVALHAVYAYFGS